MQELKPCPWCGGNDLGTTDDEYGIFGVVCWSCQAQGPGKQSSDDADEAWNRRAPDPAAARASVVEEAAKVAETTLGFTGDDCLYRYYPSGPKLAAAIRALKDQPEGGG